MRTLASMSPLYFYLACRDQDLPAMNELPIVGFLDLFCDFFSLSGDRKISR
jgi:hypothetical protein